MQPRDLGLEAAKIRDFVPEFQGYNRETLPGTIRRLAPPKGVRQSMGTQADAVLCLPTKLHEILLRLYFI